MIVSDPNLGKFSNKARLFDLESEMPKDPQVILLISWQEKGMPSIYLS